MTCAIFLDRDGTIIKEPEDEVVDSIDKVHILSNVIPALRLLTKNGYKLFFITNQIGISHGRITIDKFHSINNFVLKLLDKEGCKIIDTFFCPHKPEDNCDCRKPNPYMLYQAKDKHKIDLRQSFVIGDRKSDIELGKNTGVKTILVKTGLDKDIKINADYIAKDLLDAARYIVAHDVVRNYNHRINSVVSCDDSISTALSFIYHLKMVVFNAVADKKVFE